MAAALIAKLIHRKISLGRVVSVAETATISRNASHIAAVGGLEE